MTSSTKCSSDEEIYLKEIHISMEKELNGSGLLNLHTYFYKKNFESCPICNEWLVMRSKPEAIP